MQVQSKILFFTAGILPTEDEKAAADSISGKVCFRNGMHADAPGIPETCGAVASLGEIPKAYAEFEKAEIKVKPEPKPEPEPEPKPETEGWQS